MTEDVKEGFLCPICMRDLGNISQLQNHFDEIHEYEDKDILQSFKGIFGKAKKVLKFDANIDGAVPNTRVEKERSIYKGSNLNERLCFEFYMQPLGIYKSHTENFKKTRSERFDKYVKETNKLILRLDSLINIDYPDDINKRKEYERTVVEWIPDHLVTNCPYCSKPFNVTHRRRHHCRLCGSVLCHKCSQFISFLAAKTLTDPKFCSDIPLQPSPLSPSEQASSPLRLFQSDPSSSFPSPNLPVTTLGSLHRSDSVSSLVSYISPATGQGHVRVCPDCLLALQRRSDLLGHSQGNVSPVVRKFSATYTDMFNNVVEVKKLIPSYCAKVESLNSYGKSFYQLDQATTIRSRILKCGERIENLSVYLLCSRILSADHALNDHNGPTPIQPGLRKAVRAFACRFLKDNFLTLPRLPDRDAFKQMILQSPQLPTISANFIESASDHKPSRSDVASDTSISHPKPGPVTQTNDPITENLRWHHADPSPFMSPDAKRFDSTSYYHLVDIPAPSLNDEVDRADVPVTPSHKPYHDTPQSSHNKRHKVMPPSNPFDDVCAPGDDGPVPLTRTSLCPLTPGNMDSEVFTLGQDVRTKVSLGGDNDYRYDPDLTNTAFPDDSGQSHVPNGCSSITTAPTTRDRNRAASRGPKRSIPLAEEDVSFAQALAQQIENVRNFKSRAELTDNLEEVYVLETNLRELEKQLTLQKAKIADKLLIEDDVIV